VTADEVVPDLVIIGAARSGTSFLSATLGRHPGIDAGSVKEPNFYSSRWDQGQDWYASLFKPVDRGLKRVDASVSYTYPQHPAALSRIREAAPGALIVYTVREPLARLVSHYHLFRYYYDQREKWPSLEVSIERSPMFLGAGDYAHWLGRLEELFDVNQVLVVPFPATTVDVDDTAALLLGRLGLTASDVDLAAPAFRNEVRDFRFPALRRVQRRLQKGRIYPKVRSAVGGERLRAMRQALTKPTQLPGAEEELATLGPECRALVRAEAERATDAVDRWLQEQDARLGMRWSQVWSSHLGTAPALPA